MCEIDVKYITFLLSTVYLINKNNTQKTHQQPQNKKQQIKQPAYA